MASQLSFAIRIPFAVIILTIDGKSKTVGKRNSHNPAEKGATIAQQRSLKYIKRLSESYYKLVLPLCNLFHRCQLKNHLFAYLGTILLNL